MEKDLRPYLAHIFINFSKRSVKLVDDEGYEQNVIFKFDEEVAEGFAETVQNILLTNNIFVVSKMFCGRFYPFP